MPKYVVPGIYVQEIPLRRQTIRGVSTSTVGFIGELKSGPSIPTVITSYTQFLEVFWRHRISKS